MTASSLTMGLPSLSNISAFVTIAIPAKRRKPSERKITIVGDGDQCLLPGTMVETLFGPVRNEQVEVDEVVLGSSDHGTLEKGTVTRVHRGRWSGDVTPNQAFKRTGYARRLA